MATLLAVYNSSGCVGRCDERCYSAVGDDCTCICGGRNHKVGREKATENAREIFKELTQKEIEDWLAEKGQSPVGAMVSRGPRAKPQVRKQLSLEDLERREQARKTAEQTMKGWW